MCYYCYMNEDQKKLNKLKREQKIKSKKNDLLNAYIDSSKNLEEKIAIIKLKHEIEKSSFINGFKTLMKKK